MALFTKNAEHLDKAIKAVCPIVGVSIGKDGVPSTVRIDFAPEATAQQRVDAQGIVDGFNWSEAAELARINLAQRQRATELLNGPRQEAKLQRAVVSMLLNEINLIRAALVPPLPPRTMAQARTAISNKLADGTVDT